MDELDTMLGTPSPSELAAQHPDINYRYFTVEDAENADQAIYLAREDSSIYAMPCEWTAEEIGESTYRVVQKYRKAK